MKATEVHIPGIPQEPEAPAGLIQLADTIQNPLIVQSGVTTTTDGRWALYVTVPAGASVPIASLEKQASGYPIVYEAQPSEPTRAGPAYPGHPRHVKT